ncbi:hypothetical protein GCM10025882_27060 [Acinetobacter gyllenbergii]|uniref:Uncharacterized protein n=1 Tax=Acinetobacter gyllenbergii CIP 110306 = MTCC 11365 TaxID=1217657 RepID=A0A829HIS6_9GAMM|nr:hypothetical protein [Acinetobacter gyllenbergii]EPF88220.1 hypothetical protein F957_01507 [Acinetobacter gyllenbergii CIP 110306 = MTCC 11365]GMA12281.1 hypothetical protein GCM10025882_27060 [Acinetobacter gyllenbergii]
MKLKTVLLIFCLIGFLLILSGVDTNIYAYNVSVLFFSIGTLLSIYFLAKKDYQTSFICLVTFGPILWILVDVKNTEAAKIHREIFTILWKNDCEYTGENVHIDEESVALLYRCKNGKEVSTDEIRKIIIEGKVDNIIDSQYLE